MLQEVTSLFAYELFKSINMDDCDFMGICKYEKEIRKDEIILINGEIFKVEYVVHSARLPKSEVTEKAEWGWFEPCRLILTDLNIK